MNNMIEWFYKTTKAQVVKNETLWSTTMECWCPVGEKCLLVHYDKNTYSWLTSQGLFHARINDINPHELIPNIEHRLIFTQ